MRSILCAADHCAVAPTRMVWLPGAYHTAQDFVDAGFAQAVSRRRVGLDLQFVDMEFNHLGDRTSLQRLRSEIVLPARAAGVPIWLGGISLGGFFALDYAAVYPGELDGLCLLAPYLGNRRLITEISATGLDDWPPGELAETNDERRVWRYIKSGRDASLPLYLGFGHDDRFAAAHALLAAGLPAGSVNAVAGGHEWSTWSTLWENYLDSRFT